MEFRHEYIGIRIRVSYTDYYLVQWCGLHLLKFPVLDPALPRDAPPYTLFMSKLAMADNAAQMLQWKQFVSTCCENQFERVVPLSSPELTLVQVQQMARIPVLKICLLRQTMSITKYHRRLKKGDTRDPQLSQVDRPPM